MPRSDRDDLESSHTGNSDIEGNQIIRVLNHPAQRLLSGKGGVSICMTLLLCGRLEEIHDRFLIVNDQHLH